MRLSFIIIGILFAVILLLAAGCTQQKTAENLPTTQATIFKSPTCGCCGIYAQYMDKKGFDVTVRDVPSMDSIRSSGGVPASLQSCHTTQVGKYFVEGHVPLEAIQKLLTEQPDIAGIAMPGMPQGSPGMPGTKSGSWTIYAVNHDGSFTEFISI